MSIRSSETSVKKIDTGYLVETDKGSYDSKVTSAFVTWDEAIEYMKANAPKLYNTKYDQATSEYVSAEIA